MNTLAARFAGRIGNFDLDVAFEAPARGVTALFGPSGSGKTTVLRCLAGLERLPGAFSLGPGEVWQGPGMFLPPHRRAVGYVFQEASLFSHLSVTGNLIFGQRRAADRGVTLDDVVDLLGLGHLLHRAPARLSGGERQRVAIGRALLSQPRLLLMDEPLAALDREGKDGILPYLERLHGALSIPVVYVSHDMDEVERLADHLVLLAGGRVLGAGPLHALLADPALPPCRRVGGGAVLEGVVVGSDAAYGLLSVRVGDVEIAVPGQPQAAGTPKRLRVKAEDVGICRGVPQHTSFLNVVPAQIRRILPDDGPQATIVLGLGAAGDGAAVLARISRKSCEALDLREAERVYLQIKAAILA